MRPQSLKSASLQHHLAETKIQANPTWTKTPSQQKHRSFNSWVTTCFSQFSPCNPKTRHPKPVPQLCETHAESHDPQTLVTKAPQPQLIKPKRKCNPKILVPSSKLFHPRPQSPSADTDFPFRNRRTLGIPKARSSCLSAYSSTP